ncbi:MAG: ATP-binding protein [Nanoarchaeota archaeon]|nr:ATP-binding protein [Nanoarchaeota archaeon]
MYIERFLERKIEKYLHRKEIIAIIGARQCGKTTLMEHVFKKLKNAKFISFEDRDILELFIKDINSFVDLYAKDLNYLFIDEFQYAKDGGKQLKYIYDNYKIKIFISGSSSSELSIQSVKYLVGRIFILNLNPLSFGEYLNYKNKKIYEIQIKDKILSPPIIKEINKYYKEFAIYGGYPAVVLSSDKEEKEEVLKNIFNTYFLKEIKEILQLPEDFKLSKLIKILSLQIGGLTNYNELSTGSGFDYKELLKYLNVLKKTFICFECLPFFKNKKKELVKTPKIYFLDNGFRNIVIKNFQPLENRTDIGELNENFIASELTKTGIDTKYWRTKAGAEVDFIIEKNGEIIPIEVKSNLTNSKITRSYRNFLDEYKPEKGYVLSMNFFNQIKIGKYPIFFMPIFNIEKITKFDLNLF